MRYTIFGKTDLKVGTIGFGAWAIGGKHWGETDDRTSIKALHEAIDRGVNFIDTADVYGFGHSESLIKRVLKERRKSEVIIATKAGNDFYYATKDDDEGYGAIRQNMDPDYLQYAVEQSLRRLEVDTLDILQLHSPDLEKIDRDEPWNLLHKLKKDGKIRFAGFSIQSFKETEQATLLDRYHHIIDCIQVRYNLLERQAEQILFKKALKYNLGVIVRIPLLFGFLTGKFTSSSVFGEDDHRRMNLSSEKLERYINQLANIDHLYRKYKDQTQSQIALRFCISHAACHIAIPGAKTADQVVENCSASDLGPLPPDEIPA